MDKVVWDSHFLPWIFLLLISVEKSISSWLQERAGVAKVVSDSNMQAG